MLPSAIQENPKHPAVAGNPLILTSDVPFLKCCVTFIPDVCVPQRFCFCLVSAQNVLPKLNLLVLPLSTSHNIHPNTCFCALSNIHSSSRWFFWETSLYVGLSVHPVTYAVERSLELWVCCDLLDNSLTHS